MLLVLCVCVCVRECVLCIMIMKVFFFFFVFFLRICNTWLTLFIIPVKKTKPRRAFTIRKYKYKAKKIRRSTI